MNEIATLLDPAVIRSGFPSLRDDRIYLDNPGGTQVHESVYAAIADYYRDSNANLGGPFVTSVASDRILAEARAQVAAFLGAGADEIAFGANMTTLTYHLSRALGRGWGPGDEIVVTELDHHANIDPWRALARERGVTVRMAKLDPAKGQLDPEDLARCVGPRTRLLAIGGASNALGTINDLARAAALARAAGALFFVDAVHSAPHVLPDVRTIGCDFLACSAYKFYGPHVGILWGRHDRLAALDVPRLEPAPSEPPEHLETGTQNHEGIVGAAAAVDFLASLAGRPELSRREALSRAYEELHARGRRLFERMWNGLRAISGVTLYGPPPDAPRTPTVSFAVAGRDAHDVARALARRGVYCSSGDFYALTVVTRLGHAQDGVVRAGCAAYTTEEEVDRLVEGVREIAK
jgi:cysteine desulfurase family protein (TIGR01976 family)